MDKNLAYETLMSFVENTDNAIVKDAILVLHPELNESEDERKRKQLIDEIKEQINNIPAPDCCDSDDLKRLTVLESWLAYLEKLKEQKPVECIEFDNEFKNQVSHLLASVLNREWVYNKGFVEHITQQLLGYAKHEISPEEWSEEDERNLYNIIGAIKYTFDDSEDSGGSHLITWLKSRLPHVF